MATFGVAGQTDGADGTTENGPEQTQERLDQSNENKPIDDVTYTDANAKPQASVEDLGINVEKVQAKNPVDRVLAEVAAANAMSNAGETDEVVYSSHPIQNFSIGAYRFENTILKLKGDQVGEFETLLKGLPPQDRLHIRKIDTDRASQIVKDRMDANSLATRAFDSSVGRTALAAMQARNPGIGTKVLGEMNEPHIGLAQGSGNAPTIVDNKPDDGDGTER